MARFSGYMVRDMYIVIAVVFAVSVMWAYACLVVASDADKTMEDEFEKWKENKDDAARQDIQLHERLW